MSVVRIQCEGCNRVKVLDVGSSGAAIAEAEPGEFVEWECTRCGETTDHVILAEDEAQVLA